MKYIITESRLENLIFKYLDSTFENIEIKNGKYSDIVFVLPGEEFGLVGWNSYNKLYTNREIVENIELMFSMDESDALDVIGRYVESRYNLKVNFNRAAYSFGDVALKADTI